MSPVSLSVAGHPVASNRVMHATIGMLGAGFAVIAARELWRGGPVGPNIVVLLASAAVVALLYPALRGLTRSECIRAVLWTIGLWQVWELAFAALFFTRLYGWW